MARRTIFAGNWKMYTVRGEALALARGILEGLKSPIPHEVVLFTPAVHLFEVAALCAGGPVAVGAQNMYFEREGAFTGEISPAMVKDSGARWVLIGHSERRHVFHETDEDVNKKLRAALQAGLLPMVCVGELLDEREAEKSEDVVRVQVERAFEGLTGGEAASVVIAYEPVWAIGTGKVATPEIAQSMHGHIRAVVEKLFGGDVAGAMPILYGGSVKPDNIAGLFAMEDIDGALVGGASLKASSFLEIARVR
ncbi:MAG TPA: triose-phosphate isomerase [Spirochaetota bacterium]|nr:MAG: Triosephosphate isomerase [Spirochaetes bacterium ADurb.BinA120]HNU91234.1 triose-phosphate isomerase [Spirochaetota bacterium]HPI14880.1 triose-phosphate isomerase [Spirochaetota bacterium]HPO45089.1 triose-phosphate isomerase [Spirochaetota bacterium]HPV97867.1 triose-phosphate isomerase [Spirochaetota bacterium]